ncbi:hypothetical protein PGB90_006999 [Kerria lacca]
MEEGRVVADSEMTVVNFYSASLQRIEKRLRLGEDGKKREMNSLKFSLFMNRIAEMGFFVFVFCERNGDVENGKSKQMERYGSVIKRLKINVVIGCDKKDELEKLLFKDKE